MDSKGTSKNVLYYGTLSLILLTWLMYYAPCNYAYYNSDNAIHVLMSHGFKWPRDSYYWGQDRLGSLLPLTAFLVSKVIAIHPLYVCSIAQFLFLFTGFYLLSGRIGSRILKVALFAVLFLPVNDYNALIFLGHPYSSQLFAGVLFVYMLFLLEKQLLAHERFGIKEFFTSLLSGIGSVFFFIVGVWVSEFNAILILIPFIFILADKKLRTLFWKRLKNIWFILFIGISASALLFFYNIYKQLKQQADPDGLYEKFLIDNTADLKKNIHFFTEKLKISLLFRDHATVENLFNWFIILLTLLIIVMQLKNRKKERSGKLTLAYALVFVCIASTIALFLSTWNLRSEFCPRYFTPVYVMYCFSLLLFIDQRFYKKTLKGIITGCFLAASIFYCYNVVIDKHLPGPFKLYSDYKKLPRGTLMGDYWDTYKIASIAIDSLKPLPFEYMQVRNWAWKDELLSENNFYFLNNDKALKGGLSDVVKQFGINFKFSGIKYTCNQTEVWLYHKFKFPEHTRLQTANNKYIAIGNDQTLTEEPDSSKAETFELMELAGKYALKSSKGKYVCADRGRNNILIARSDNAGEWETFDIVIVDSKHINLRSSTGKFVCIDPDFKNALVANRDQAKEWETFTLK